jgi:hypothetical protein
MNHRPIRTVFLLLLTLCLLARATSAAEPTAHDPQFDQKGLWPEWLDKTDFVKEEWPKARVLVWANPGVTVRGVDLANPANWLEDGKPATSAPDAETDVIFPSGDKPYRLAGEGQSMTCRHLTIEPGMTSFIKTVTITGNMWVKKGGGFFEVWPKGAKSTFMRNDNDKPVHIANKIAFNRPPDKSIEWLGDWRLGDELDLFSGRFIVSPGSTFLPGDRSTQHIYPKAQLILLSGSSFMKRGAQYGFHDMEIEGKLLAGTPERPLEDDVTLAISFKPKGVGKPHNSSAKDRGLILYQEGVIAVHSAKPTEHKLIIKRNTLPTQSFAFKNGEPPEVAKMDHGIDLILLGTTDFNGVEFHDVLKGGIHMPDPSAQKQWKNVSFGKNFAEAEELFTQYTGSLDIKMSNTGVAAERVPEAAERKRAANKK